MPKDRIRGMSNLPLSPVGRREAMFLAERLARKGVGPKDRVISSPLARAQETAKIIVAHTGARFGGTAKELEPWHLGGFEGRDSEEIAPKIKHFIEHPDERVPGAGMFSMEPGETFHTFETRFIPYLKAQYDLRQPGERVLLVCHYRNIKMAEAWLGKGTASDLLYDEVEMSKHDPKAKTTEVYILLKGGPAGLKLLPVELAPTGMLPEGLYCVRHGSTLFNAENSQPGSKAGS